MAGFYSDEFLESLRSRSDLVQVVSQYVPLKQKNRRFWGCCPFHSEKTPSFSVDADKQLYYCFGCHNGGNVIHFLMNIEKMSFPEAVAQLAERAGMPLPQHTDDANYTRRKKQRERLYAALREAALHYHGMLQSDEAEHAREYLVRRGLTDRQIRRFGIGYASKSWQSLTDHLLQKGFVEDELVSAGLTSVKNGRQFDFFRDKVMFPIIDQRSRVVGFGGRILQGDGPKYINTADTPVYNKREMLYGLNFYRSFGADRELFVVEGYMDLIAVSTAGFNNVVASLGTALTTEQVRLMRRFADTVYIAYDGDTAGRNATLRGLDLVEREGISVRVLVLPENIDPDDVVRKQGKEAFLALKNEALTLTEFKMLRIREQCDMESEDGRMRFAQQAATLIRDAGPVERERYLKTISKLSGFSMEALKLETGQVANVQARSKMKKKDAAPPKSNMLEQRIISLMASDPRIRAQAFLTLAEADFAHTLYRSMFSHMADMHQEDCTAMLLDRYTDPAQAAEAAQVLSMQQSATDRMMMDYMIGLKLQGLEREVDELNRESKQAGTDVHNIAAQIHKRMILMEELRNKRVGGALDKPSARRGLQ